MCWCTPAKRTPICEQCPPINRASFPVSWGGTGPEPTAAGDAAADSCPVPDLGFSPGYYE